MSLEDRFVKIVREMDSQIVALEKVVTDLRSQLRMANFPNEVVRKCGKCGEMKPVMWKSDVYGYVCVACAVDEEREESQRKIAEKDTEIDQLQKELILANKK